MYRRKVLAAVIAAAVLTAGCAKKEETFEMKMRAIDQYMADKINVCPCPCETKGGLTRLENWLIRTALLTSVISTTALIVDVWIGRKILNKL
jgi:hypothetical protein